MQTFLKLLSSASETECSITGHHIRFCVRLHENGHIIVAAIFEGIVSEISTRRTTELVSNKTTYKFDVHFLSLVSGTNTLLAAA